MSDTKLGHSYPAHHRELCVTCVSEAYETVFILNCPLSDDLSEAERRHEVLNFILKSLSDASCSRGCSKVFYPGKLKTHVVVLLPVTTVPDDNGEVGYHQYCCLVRAECPLTRSEVLKGLDLVCSFLDEPTANEVSCSSEHVEHTESGVYCPGDVLYGFYHELAEQEDQMVPTSYSHNSAVTNKHTHDFTTQAMPMHSPHSSDGSNDDAVVPSTSEERKFNAHSGGLASFDNPPLDNLQPSFEKRTRELNPTQIQNLGLQESEASSPPILHRQLSYNDGCCILKDENLKSTPPPTTPPSPSSYTAPPPQPAASYNDNNAAGECVLPTQTAPTYAVSAALVVGHDTNIDQQLEEKFCSCGRTNGVHYLEAVCAVPFLCQEKLPLNQYLIDNVAKSMSDIREGMNPDNSEAIKGYIREHCDTGCSDHDCGIPHLYAGCAFPDAEPSLSNTEPWEMSPQPANGSGLAGSFVTARHHVDKQAVERVTESEQHQEDYGLDARHAPDARHVINRMPPVPLQPVSGMHNGDDEAAAADNLFNFPENMNDYRRGKIIYKRRGMDYICPGDDFRYVPDPSPRNMLGKGSNGRVIQHSIGQCRLALKLTKYRASELDIWKSLRHPNIIPLLAVVAYDSERCYQVMPQMTGTLRDQLHATGYTCLLDLFNECPSKQALVMGNVRYVIWEVLQGLKYLEEHNIKHGDIKLKNVLVKCHCDCPSVFLCECPHGKPSIKLADFDSAKKVVTASPESYHFYGDYPVARKTPKECARVLGTFGFRALEQFLKTTQQCHEHVDLDGPWCDSRALGMMVMVLFMGHDENNRKTAWNILGKPYRQDIDKSDPTFEGVYTLAKELEMYKEPSYNPHVRIAAEFVSCCVKEDYRDRPSASQLLESPFFRVPL